MSAQMLGSGIQQIQMAQQPSQQQQQQQRQHNELQQVIMRVNFLRSNPKDQRDPNELERLMKYIQQVSQQRRGQAGVAQNSGQPTSNGHAIQSLTNGTIPTPASLASGSVPTQVYPTSQTPVSFTNDQLNTLKAQIHAFKLISRGQPVPEHIQQSIRIPNTAVADLQKVLQGPDVQSKIVDAGVKTAKGEPGTPSMATAILREGTVKPEDLDIPPIDSADYPKGPFLEDNVNSGIYPYNAYRHPFSHLKRPAEMDPKLFATRLQRLLIPTIMPAGLDAHQIINERERYIDARIQQRIRELEDMPATMGDGSFEAHIDVSEGDKDDKENDSTALASTSTPLDTLKPYSALIHPSPSAHGKLRGIIELKSLRLLDKQRIMRAQIAERLAHGTMLPINRVDFRRVRKPTIRDTRTTEHLERKQRLDREQSAKRKHVDQLMVICAHGRKVIEVNRAAQDRVTRLGRAVLSFHAYTEKEEQKRIERLAKERLRALKADDEEAYMKLIDTAKDTRITHLLRQTDGYLDSLAHAVVAQQNASGPLQDYGFEQEEGPANENTFGAQVDPDSVDSDRKIDYYAVAHRISEKITKQPDMLVGGKLKDYQLKGLQWMVSLYNNRLNGILADEMGLGKTIQTISLITFLIESKRQRGPYLVIVPLSTMTNWSGEFAKWAPSVQMVAYKGNPAQRRALQGDLRVGQFQVLLTTYEYVIKDRPILSKIKWIHMIIDEGHRMKNTQSKLVQTLNTYYHSRHHLILTGTPLQNNLPELWSLLNFVLPKIFNSVKSFDEWFNTPFANSGTGDKIELNEEEALLIIRRLHKVLRPFLLRRLKKDVESELPDKVEKVIKIRMSALQNQLYKQMKKHKMIASGKDSKGKPGGVRGLSNELMQLRKICQHPFLFESVEDKISPQGFIDDKLIRTSGKIELLSRILPKFFATGHRVLIFFQMTKVMDIMEDFLKYMGWKYLRLDGGTKTEERATFVQLFNAKESEYTVFILSTRAGGLGLNLQTADTVIIFDSDWNPHADLQAQDRAHRIGQTRAVLILRFITEKSVEEAMYQRARYKLDIDDKVIQAGRFDNKSTVEEQEEFLRSILEADQDEDNEEAGDMNDEELNELIARHESETSVFRELDVKRERDALEAWRAAGNRGKPPPQLMQLEELPECYQTDEPFDDKDAEEVFEGRGARKRNNVSYTDGLDDDTWAMALEDGEDIQELADRTREKKDRRAHNKLIKDTEVSGRNTPASDIMEGGSSRGGRKPKKGKAKANDYEPATGSKRKRGMKSLSITPDGDEDDDDEVETYQQKRRKTKGAKIGGNDLPAATRDKMKKAFMECHKAVLACEDETGRKRCELFRELPDKRDYPNYYEIIDHPISLSQLRKRSTTNSYKNVQAFREDWRLMFSNARTFNQEGSWVYVDAEEMEKVFNAAWDRVIVGSDLPGAPAALTGGGSGSASGSYASALTPMEEDDRPPPPTRGRSGSSRKQVLSEEEYLTPSDDE
ncbi:SNF2-family ATP dependent chromatin remodeling factor snf21 [Crepidotus variabilis]|uniref:SNF2-family ATP dependent chromatin remodeling factor snf21 n=1 Tax=Crepidotus variabilis TaxID=179855 RepID=A0A9P6E8J1_9AGAR|nr:SNF2-family ATP dependent chromatin remodeling factor snf21 [Crepidotus variabilis]